MAMIHRPWTGAGRLVVVLLLTEDEKGQQQGRARDVIERGTGTDEVPFPVPRALLPFGGLSSRRQGERRGLNQFLGLQSFSW